MSGGARKAEAERSPTRAYSNAVKTSAKGGKPSDKTLVAAGKVADKYFAKPK